VLALYSTAHDATVLSPRFEQTWRRYTQRVTEREQPLALFCTTAPAASYNTTVAQTHPRVVLNPAPAPAEVGMPCAAANSCCRVLPIVVALPLPASSDRHALRLNVRTADT
jgi:hypothetical protein